jgi:hypothetical protein
LLALQGSALRVEAGRGQVFQAAHVDSVHREQLQHAADGMRFLFQLSVVLNACYRSSKQRWWLKLCDIYRPQHPLILCGSTVAAAQPQHVRRLEGNLAEVARILHML